MINEAARMAGLIGPAEILCHSDMRLCAVILREMRATEASRLAANICGVYRIPPFCPQPPSDEKPTVVTTEEPTCPTKTPS